MIIISPPQAWRSFSSFWNPSRERRTCRPQPSTSILLKVGGNTSSQFAHYMMARHWRSVSELCSKEDSVLEEICLLFYSLLFHSFDFFYPPPFIFLKHTQIKICMYTLASSSLLPLFKRVSAWWQKLLPPYLMASNLGLAKWYLALRGCSVKPSWVSGCSCQETASEKHWWIWALKMESGRQRCWHRGGL